MYGIVLRGCLLLVRYCTNTGTVRVCTGTSTGTGTCTIPGSRYYGTGTHGTSTDHVPGYHTKSNPMGQELLLIILYTHAATRATIKINLFVV